MLLSWDECMACGYGCPFVRVVVRSLWILDTFYLAERNFKYAKKLLVYVVSLSKLYGPIYFCLIACMGAS